ncbi:MAG: phytanoyl-CoA dioxygenase family protein [Acidobacteriota bacterium]
MNIAPDFSASYHAEQANALGYTLIKQVYDAADIDRIAHTFDDYFVDKLRQHKVQSRDYKRFTCKLPISEDYRAILDNVLVHQVLTQLLGENYVLFNFNSHSALPGSSSQAMHVDSVNPYNSQTYVSGQANVAFLHIPMLDTEIEHGATEMWPAIFYQRSNAIADAKWVRDHLPKSPAHLQRGDVVIKLDNCLHAGGKNQSHQRRHMITMIFARQHFYLTGNSGMVPCDSYRIDVPFRVASQCARVPADLQAAYTADKQKPGYSAAGLQGQLKFQQYGHLSGALPAAWIEALQQQPQAFIDDASRVFNLVDFCLPALQAAFGRRAFQLHSVNLSNDAREPGCDDPTFVQGSASKLFNNADSMISVHIPLQQAERWLAYFPGNKTLSAQLLAGSRQFQEQRRSMAAAPGDLVLTTGSLVYGYQADVPVLRLTFVAANLIPSYDDRYWVTDRFALSLPDRLGKLLRYDSIYLTDGKYKDFVFKPVFYAISVVLNYLDIIRTDRRVMGSLLFALAGVLFLPAFVYYGTQKRVPGLLSTS